VQNNRVDKAKYCSMKCYSQHHRGERHNNYVYGFSSGSKINCLYCNKEFIRKAYKQKYCCVSHQLKYEYENSLRDKYKIGIKAREVSHRLFKEHNWLNDKQSRDNLRRSMNTLEYKEKIRITKLGSKNPMFGKTPWNKQEVTKKWWEEKSFLQLRKECIKRDKCCVVCGDKNKDLYCDHIIPYRICKEHNLGNLQMLCGSCHSKKTARDIKNYPQLTKKYKLE
jgi:hypothetical protein